MLHYFHITCLMHQAWVVHLFKLTDIDSLPTWSSEKQQLGSGVRGTVTICGYESEELVWVCRAYAHLCKLHTLVPLFLLVLAAVDMCSKPSWEWELVLAVAFNPVCALPTFNSPAESWQGCIQLWSAVTSAAKQRMKSLRFRKGEAAWPGSTCWEHQNAAEAWHVSKECYQKQAA